jgi:hypothetical protein
MPIPSWVPGQVLAASDVNNWFIPVAAVKTLDQQVTSNSTTLVNDNELVVSVAANATYQFSCYLDYEAAVGPGDFQWKWAVPTLATLRYQRVCVDATGVVQVHGTSSGGIVNTAQGAGPGVLQGVSMTGTLVTLGTPGVIQLQWAQNTTSSTATIMHAQSFLVLRRLG